MFSNSETTGLFFHLHLLFVLWFLTFDIRFYSAAVTHEFLLRGKSYLILEMLDASAELCCCEAEIWYYRILENLISQEKRRLGVGDVSVSVLPSCGHTWSCCRAQRLFPLSDKCYLIYYASCSSEYFCLFRVCVWSEALAPLPGLLGEQSRPVLPCDLLSGDHHMLKPSTLWLPCTSSDLQRSTISLWDGVFPSLLTHI